MGECIRCRVPVTPPSELCRSCHGERERLRAALEREAVDRALLADCGRLSLGDIAARDGVSRSAVSARLARARQRMALLDRERACVRALV